MLKKTLMATSTAMVLAAGSLQAQDKPLTDTTTIPKADTTTTVDKAASPAFVTGAEQQLLASRLIGQPIYNTEGDEVASIGEVNDVVLTPDGKVNAVVIGVGGFLGIGEKEVALPLSSLKLVTDTSGARLVASVTKDQLQNAPSFDRSALQKAEADAAPMPQTTLDTTGTNNPGMMDATNPGVSTDPLTGSVTNNGQPVAKSSTPVPDAAKLSANDLFGISVYGPQKENIGSIGDVIATKDGTVTGFVVDVGGFLGIGEKEVAMSLDSVTLMRDGSGQLVAETPFTEDQLQKLKPFDETEFDTDSSSDAVR